MVEIRNSGLTAQPVESVVKDPRAHLLGRPVPRRARELCRGVSRMGANTNAPGTLLYMLANTLGSVAGKRSRAFALVVAYAGFLLGPAAWGAFPDTSTNMYYIQSNLNYANGDYQVRDITDLSAGCSAFAAMLNQHTSGPQLWGPSYAMEYVERPPGGLYSQGACHFTLTFSNGGVMHTWESFQGPYTGYVVCPANSTLANSACVPQPPQRSTVTLLGLSATHVADAGPSLPQTAHVDQNGLPAAGKQVTVQVKGSKQALQGVTDGAGNFVFTYVPPSVPTTAALTASCSDCQNTADKTIEVAGLDAGTCTAAGSTPGTLVGNPINVASGEKLQYETDWVDASPNPMTFARTYGSASPQIVQSAGLGPNWTHSFWGTVAGASEGKIVYLGDGTRLALSPISAGVYAGMGAAGALIVTADGQEFTRGSDDSRWKFDLSGRLLSISQRNGWTTSLQYNGAGQLVSATNAFGRTLSFAYDAAGYLSSVTPPDGTRVAFTFAASGRLASAVSAAGESTSYLYEDSRWPNALTGTVDGTGVRIGTYSYDANGLAISTSHVGGADSYRLTYDASASSGAGSLVAGVNAEAATSERSVQIVDPLGNARSVVIKGGDGDVHLVTAGSPADGSSVANRSFIQGSTLAAAETDFVGVTTLFTWDLNRRLKTAETRAAGRPEAQSTSIQWHPTFRLPVLVSEPGRTTAFTYDALGNLITQTITDLASGQARRWQWAYTPQGLVSTMTDPRGAVWTFGYDSFGNRVTARDPLGQTTTYGYDAAGRITRQTDPNGLVTKLAYDGRGRLIQVSRDAEVTSFAYTPTGKLASAVLPNGYAVNYSYDAAQRLIGATDNRGASIAFMLDGMGNRVHEEVKDASGNIALATSRVINSLNRVAAIQGSVGQTTNFAYDANGELVAQTDPLNQSTRQALDGLRRPTSVAYADNATASQGWNQLDQLTHVTDPKGVRTTYARNAFGEVVSESSPDIGTISYTRDGGGNVVQMKDAKGQITNIDRDSLGRPIRIGYADGKQVSLDYDATGFVSTMTDRSGSTRFTRDAQGRVLGKTQQIAIGVSTQFTLSSGYKYFAGDLQQVTYPSGMQVTYRHQAGQIVEIDVRPPGPMRSSAPFVSELLWTPLGQPKSWTWSNGDKALRSFDTDGRMVQNEFARYTWDAASRISSITQLLWASSNRGQAKGHERDGARDTTRALQQMPVSWAVGYDSRNRVTSFVRTGSETRYTYDANSNRLTSVEVAGGDLDLDGFFAGDANRTQTESQQSTLDPQSNRLLGFVRTVSVSRQGRAAGSASYPVTYTVDANGSLTSDGVRTFDYDASNRLAKVRVRSGDEPATITYLHNAAGQRVFKSDLEAERREPRKQELGEGFLDWLRHRFGNWLAGGERVQLGNGYLYADGVLPTWALLGEYGTGGGGSTGSVEYIWLPTDSGGAVPIGMYRAGELFAIHGDHLGTPRLVTDAANEPVWQWPYTAFGDNQPVGVLRAKHEDGRVQVSKTEPGMRLDLRFPGQHFDAEVGTFYNYFRNYDPAHGRYAQSDPIGLRGGINTYAYVTGNPLSYYDPSGLWPTGQQSTAGGKNQACVAACTAAGAVFGGASGSVVGGAIGGVGGAAGGTLVAPGPGTVGGGIAGVGVGADVGGVLGAGLGGALGNSIGQAMCPSNDDQCEKKRDQDEALCVAIAGARYGRRGVAVCMSSATQRYSECLRSGVNGIRTPLHGVDTPL